MGSWYLEARHQNTNVPPQLPNLTRKPKKSRTQEEKGKRERTLSCAGPSCNGPIVFHLLQNDAESYQTPQRGQESTTSGWEHSQAQKEVKESRDKQEGEELSETSTR